MEECIDCGACEPECPVEAIFPEDALPDKWEPFVKINYAYGDGMGVVNQLTNAYAAEHNVQSLKNTVDASVVAFGGSATAVQRPLLALEPLTQ